jgi:hypothetical protein
LPNGTNSTNWPSKQSSKPSYLPNSRVVELETEHEIGETLAGEYGQAEIAFHPFYLEYPLCANAEFAQDNQGALEIQRTLQIISAQCT